MSDLLITKSGALVLARMLFSCEPLIAENDMYVWLMSQKEGDEFSYQELLNGLPRPMPISALHLLRKFAVDSQVEKITPELIYCYFGGDSHGKKVVGEIEEFEQSFGQKPWFPEWVVGHTLLPVEWQNTKNNVCSAVYKNQGLKVRLAPIFIPQNVVVKEGRGLVHFATAIFGACDSIVSAKISAEQSENATFRESCERCSQIDYTAFAMLGNHYAKTKKRFARLTRGA